MALSILDRLLIIYERSGLSVSKFAQIISKDRRTLTSWIDKSVQKQPSQEVLDSVSAFFRYPSRIWESSCGDDEFLALLQAVPRNEISIIDKGYEGSLEYILERESKRRFVIHPRFPSPAYRDKIVSFPYHFGNSQRADELRALRCEQMFRHEFESIEWYSIESMLRFAFCPIGNLFTKAQKIALLELMLESLRDNYNKSLYLFDAYSTKVFGIGHTYISLLPDQGLMFIKMPIDSMILEIANRALVQRIHTHFTSPSHAPRHIPKDLAPMILRLLLESIAKDRGQTHGLEEFCQNVGQEFGQEILELFLNNLSPESRTRLEQSGVESVENL